MAYPATPERQGDHPVVHAEEARQGEATGHVRYVLGTSLVLAVAAGVIVYLAVFI